MMEQVIFFTSAAIAFGYVALIMWIMTGWDDTAEWDTPPADYVPKTKVAVVIAARNEEQHIERCIRSVLSQSMASDIMEVLVVDDQSTDSTSAVVLSIDDERVTLLHTTEGYTGKKAAISLAVEYTNSTVIATTDADCVVGENWLRSLLYQYELNKPKLIAGPIVYDTDRSLLQRFQYLDGVGNMAVTANGIRRQAYYMANGANLFYEKLLFNELGGYKDDSVSSGDDMLLIQRAAAAYPDYIRYLKCQAAVVHTRPVSSVSELISQRKRWATKSKNYSDKGIVKVQAYVFMTVLFMVANIILIPFTSGFSLFAFLFLAFMKGCMDYLLLSRMASYFGNRKPLESFMGAYLYFSLYILWAGWSALFPSSYMWKGRRVQ